MVTTKQLLDRNDPSTWPVALTVSDVACILGMSVTGVYKMIQKKQIPSKKIGGAVRVAKTSILKLLGE